MTLLITDSENGKTYEVPKFIKSQTAATIVDDVRLSFNLYEDEPTLEYWVRIGHRDNESTYGKLSIDPNRFTITSSDSIPKSKVKEAIERLASPYTCKIIFDNLGI